MSLWVFLVVATSNCNTTTCNTCATVGTTSVTTVSTSVPTVSTTSVTTVSTTSVTTVSTTSVTTVSTTSVTTVLWCSGHGTFYASCVCDAGFHGSDCSGTCEEGWSGEDCSYCAPGFYGSECSDSVPEIECRVYPPTQIMLMAACEPIAAALSSFLPGLACAMPGGWEDGSTDGSKIFSSPSCVDTVYNLTPGLVGMCDNNLGTYFMGPEAGINADHPWSCDTAAAHLKSLLLCSAHGTFDQTCTCEEGFSGEDCSYCVPGFYGSDCNVKVPEIGCQVTSGAFNVMIMPACKPIVAALRSSVPGLDCQNNNADLKGEMFLAPDCSDGTFFPDPYDYLQFKPGLVGFCTRYLPGWRAFNARTTRIINGTEEKSDPKTSCEYAVMNLKSLLSCSEHGTFIDGSCVCNAGFYGSDCNVTTTTVTATTVTTTTVTATTVTSTSATITTTSATSTLQVSPEETPSNPPGSNEEPSVCLACNDFYWLNEGICKADELTFFDEDDDGQMSRSEARMSRRTFDAYDTNGDDIISKTEFYGIADDSTPTWKWVLLGLGLLLLVCIGAYGIWRIYKWREEKDIARSLLSPEMRF
jgi:hypothetical protein